MHFFEKLEFMYKEIVVNSYDYHYITGDNARCQTVQWRLSSLEGFRLLIGAIGLVSKSLSTVIDALTELKTMYAAPDPNNPVTTYCTPQQACHIYARFLMNVFKTPGCIFIGQPDCFDGTGLPAYITSAAANVSLCASNLSLCNPEQAPWNNFDFSDIPITPINSTPSL